MTRGNTYSITSSTWASNVGEIVRPSACAVFSLSRPAYKRLGGSGRPEPPPPELRAPPTPEGLAVGDRRPDRKGRRNCGPCLLLNVDDHHLCEAASRERRAVPLRVSKGRRAVVVRIVVPVGHFPNDSPL